MVRAAPASAESRNNPSGRRARALAVGTARAVVRVRTTTFAVVVALAAVCGAPDALARPASDTIAVAQLPPEGRQVLAEIQAGGPFAFRRDGIVFGNREGQLPRERRGYYAEYTVPTPGVRTRGARRIIAGRGTTGDFRTSGEYYYTNDHYRSFSRIVQ